MVDFFKNRRSDFHLVEEDPPRPGFRSCQLGAVWAVRSHFTVSQEHALINMPTGSGKTAVMTALAFELGARRAFILTPSKLIRKQTARKFAALKLLGNIGAYSGGLPQVKEVTSKRKNPDKWRELLEYDVVVATPQTVSPAMTSTVTEEKGSQSVKVVSPPKSFFAGQEPEFDVVFVDEAHHSPAKIWANFLKLVNGPRVIYLTATPFRRDRKRIRAIPVYSYPISRAMDDGIYRTVTFEPVHHANRDSRDSLMAEKAYAHLQKLRKTDPEAAAIVKAEDIEHAKDLLAVYEENGWEGKIDVIHSRRTLGANQKVIDRVHSERNKKDGVDRLDGFISVAMGGEGLDMPNLRLAVFHRTPQTLPYTVQLIGRVSRIKGADKGDAVLIADPAVAKGREVQELYKSDRGWSQILPKLFQRYTRSSRSLHEPGRRASQIPSLLKEDLKPYLSARLYQAEGAVRIRSLKPAVDLESLETTDLDIEILEWRPDAAIVVTKTVEQPRWTTDTILESDHYDLHIFYAMGSLIFEFTSSDRICRAIRQGVHNFEKLERLGNDLLRNALADAVDAHYFMLGLRNQSGLAGGLPEYKIFLGENVETAIKHSDGRNYGPGHAAMKKGKETRGIALSTSRVWSSKRSSLNEFQAWCKKVGKLISQLHGQPIPIIEDLLMVHRVIAAYPDDLNPISILFTDAMLLSEKVEVTVDGETLENPVYLFAGKELNQQRTHLDTALQLVDPDTGEIWRSIPLRHSLLGPFWQLRSNQEVDLEVDPGPGQPTYGGPLKEVLRDLPPRVLLDSGATIIENIIYSPRIQDQRFNETLLEAKDWTGTDLKKEATAPRPGFLDNVLQRTAKIIKQEYTLMAEDLLVCDDRANEIADFVLIQQSILKVTFFHCKYKKSSGKSPGTAREDVSELVDQGVRTGYWIQAPGLMSRLSDRVAGKSEVVIGSLTELEKLARRFYPTQWDYEVIAVQPGISKSKIEKSKRRPQSEELLIVLKDRTLDLGAGFKVWCSP